MRIKAIFKRIEKNRNNLYSNDIGIVTVWLNNNSTPNCTATGSILREYWANIPGHNIQDIPLNSLPTSSSQLTTLRTVANVADNYGQRIRGYICAPASGTYTFFLQGDDVAELYLSTDNNPANKQRIASAKVAWNWTDNASQQSAPVNLVAGKSYYQEVLHKEGSGGDQVRVGWRTPGMATTAEPVIIPGAVLSPFQYLIQPPSSLSATATSSSEIHLSWLDASNEETGYVVERATAEAGPYAKVATLAANTTSYDDRGLALNTTYFYRVYATAEPGASAYSNVVNVSTETCQAVGTILREYWANIPGHNIKDIPVNTPPTSTSQLTILRTPANVADNYGQRIRGYICAPTTGNYTFFIQGDDVAELYLSSDKSPANKQRIASARVAWSWTDNASQQSALISLVAGQRYYLEVLHKEGVGGDQVRVGWRTPSMATDSEPVIIPGSVLSPFVPATPEPANGLLACYAFSGNANDGSGQGNNGTVNGATLTTDRFGNANSAYAFNGVSDYISIPSTSLQNNTYTYSLWAKATSLPPVGNAAFPLSIGSFGGDQAISLANQYVDSIYQGWTGGGYNTNGASNFYNVGSLPALNSWYHLALTRSSSTVSFYVNGQLAGTVSTDGFPAAYTGNSAIIGARFSLNQFFQGAIDDIQIYNKALSAAEVTTLYQRTGNPCPATTAARRIEPRGEGLLSQLKAYPNPTTGVTTVEFRAAETGWLAVQLYNLQGQPLQQLFAEEVAAGSVHQRALDATFLPSGLYLIRLVNGKRVEHHKLLVSH